MAEYKAGPRQRPPTHPGRVVEEALSNLRLSQRAAASAMQVTPTALGNVISGKAAVTPEMALRLGRFLGNGAEMWLAMQRAYDLWHAEKRLGSALSGIEPAKFE